MECSRVFSVVFTGLVLATAGFCLTLAGWFAPPINDSVRGVRLAGPILLVVGLLILALSCLICAVRQERCCYRCLALYRDRRKLVEQRHLERAAAGLRVTPNVTALDESRSGGRRRDVIDSDGDAAPAEVASGAHGCPVFANRSAGLDRSPLAGRTRISRDRPPTDDDLDPEAASTMYEGVGVRVKQFRKLSPRIGDRSEAIHLLEEVTSSPTTSPRASPHARSSARQNAPDRVGSRAQSTSGSDGIAQSPKLCSHVMCDNPEANVSRMWDPGPVWTPRTAPRRSKLQPNRADDTYIQHSNV